MPKIAAALAVFLTVVTCIGYNTARYPVVWEMVALSDGFTQSRRSEPPAPFPESADSPPSEGLATATTPDESAPRRRSDWSSQEDSQTARDSNAARPNSSYASYHDGGSPYAEGDSSGEEEDAPGAGGDSSYETYAGGDTSYGAYATEGSSDELDASGDSSYGSYGSGGSSYDSCRSGDSSLDSYASGGSSYDSYDGGDSGDTDDGSSRPDEDYSHDESSHGNDRSDNASGYSGYAHERESYDDTSPFGQSNSDSNEPPGYTYDGSSGGSEDRGDPQTEDRDAAENDKPAHRVAMRQERNRSGAWSDAGTRGAADPVAPLREPAASGRHDDDSTVGAGDVTGGSHVGTQGSSGAWGSADPPSGPVEATAGGKYASGPPESRSASSDGYAYSPSYSDADSYSAGSTVSASAGGLTDSAASRGSAGATVSGGSTPRGASGESTADATSESTLVPIQPAGPSSQGGEPPGGVLPDEESTAVASRDYPRIHRVERLPPVDQVATVPGARPLGADDALPVYPSAGVE